MYEGISDIFKNHGLGHNLVIFFLKKSNLLENKHVFVRLPHAICRFVGEISIELGCSQHGFSENG